MRICRAVLATLLLATLAQPVSMRAQATTTAVPAGNTNPTVRAEEDVRQAERDRFAAMVKADTGALQKLLAAELSYTHSNAQVQDRAAFVADIKSGAIKYLSIEPNDVNVRVFGNAAVVTGAASLHVTQNGTDLSLKIRYTNMHISRNGSWQMVAWEATRVP